MIKYAVTVRKSWRRGTHDYIDVIKTIHVTESRVGAYARAVLHRMLTGERPAVQVCASKEEI